MLPKGYYHLAEAAGRKPDILKEEGGQEPEAVH